MSTVAAELWEKIALLAPEDRAELVGRLLASAAGSEAAWPDPAPLGAFDGMDTPEEILELNALARSSAIELPPDLE